GNAANNIPLDDNGEVKLDEEFIIGTAPEVFGEKIYAELEEQLATNINDVVDTQDTKLVPDAMEVFKKQLQENAVAPLVQMAKDHYGEDLKPSDEKLISRQLNAEIDVRANRVFGDYHIQQRTIEKERKDALDNLLDTGKTEQEVNREFDEKQKKALEQLQNTLHETVNSFVTEAPRDLVRTVETKKKEREKDSIEDSIRDHLRGFSRTIPSFLMAYGDDKVTLITFDQIIPDIVFREVTSITLDQFRFLRDGGDYTDPETGETKHFDGHLFEPVVFDDSVKEFMRLQYALADYFDEKST
ncbi:MAG: restriction endonuclease, partial [Spirochaetales bacterium]|nr:restriction endonuclease [Spirochaetales bacterium]